MTITRQQRHALHALFSIGPLVRRGQFFVSRASGLDHPTDPITYRQFRRALIPLIAGDGCIMIPFQGMWVGIERDGYTHS